MPPAIKAVNIILVAHSSIVLHVGAQGLYCPGAGINTTPKQAVIGHLGNYGIKHKPPTYLGVLDHQPPSLVYQVTIDEAERNRLLNRHLSRSHAGPRQWDAVQAQQVEDLIRQNYLAPLTAKLLTQFPPLSLIGRAS